jgi:hypothetical protein
MGHACYEMIPKIAIPLCRDKYAQKYSLQRRVTIPNVRKRVMLLSKKKLYIDAMIFFVAKYTASFFTLSTSECQSKKTEWAK